MLLANIDERHIKTVLASEAASFRGQILMYIEDMLLNHRDIVGQNLKVTKHREWDDYRAIRAENTFIKAGDHVGISKYAYRMVMIIIGNKSQRDAVDSLISSKSVSDKRTSELCDKDGAKVRVKQVDFPCDVQGLIEQGKKSNLFPDTIEPMLQIRKDEIPF